METKKISKWDAAPESIRMMLSNINALCDGLTGDGFHCEEAGELEHLLVSGLEAVLDDYNELEAKYQESCGMISQYEEENRNLKSERDDLISRVLKQDDEYAKLNEELYEVKKEREDLVKKRAELEKENTLNKKMQTEYCDIIEARLNQQHHNKFIDLKSKCKSEIKQVIDLAKSYGVIIYDGREDAIPNGAINFSMCGPYYVLDEQIKNENDRLRNRCNEITYRNTKYAWAIKTILKKATFSPGHIAEELRFMARESTTPKDVTECWEGYADELLGEHSKLVDKINQLEKKNDNLKKENDNLKQTILNILEKLETKVGLCRVHLLDSYENRANLIAVEHDKLLIKYEKLKVENNNLTTDTKRLSDAVEAWFNMFNDMRHKRDDLKKENKKLEEALNDKNKLIYKLTPRKGNVGNKRVPPTECCGCCNICARRDICWILND